MKVPFVLVLSLLHGIALGNFPAAILKPNTVVLKGRTAPAQRTFGEIH